MPSQLELDINRPAWHDADYEPLRLKYGDRGSGKMVRNRRHFGLVCEADDLLARKAKDTEDTAILAFRRIRQSR